MVYATLVLMLLFKFYIAQSVWWLAQWGFGWLWWCLYIPFTFVIAGLYICVLIKQIESIGPNSYSWRPRSIKIGLLISNLTLFTFLSTKWQWVNAAF